jgi:hypothetical protein
MVTQAYATGSGTPVRLEDATFRSRSLILRSSTDSYLVKIYLTALNESRDKSFKIFPLHDKI